MAAFGGFTLTNRGRALQAKAQAGATLNYTKAMVGDGSITSQSIVTLTNLISPKMTLPITGVRAAPPDRAYVESRFNNQSIAIGFYFREIGIYAQDPDVGEILYAYANSGQNAEYIPPTGGSDIVEKSIRMNVFVGTATNIKATIDSSLVFPTRQEVEEMIAAIEVEVVDSYESTDKTVAPSADALRRGLALKQDILRLADNYLAASVLVNAAPDPNTGRAYPDGLSFFKVSSSSGGWPTANGYVETKRAGSGGTQTFYEMYTGAVQTDKTARVWTRSKRDSNSFWQDGRESLTEIDYTALQKYVDDKAWQKHKLTEDNGASKSIIGQNLNNIVTGGDYDGNNLINSPNGSSNWFYIQVQRHSNSDDYVVQNAFKLTDTSTPTFYQRVKSGGVWYPWSEDLFTSVSNGKTSLKTAVTGKGGTVTQAGSVPTFAELVTGVNSISQTNKSNVAVTFATMLPRAVNNIVTFPPGIKKAIYAVARDTKYINVGSVYNGGSKEIRVSDGINTVSLGPSPGGGVVGLIINIAEKTAIQERVSVSGVNIAKNSVTTSLTTLDLSRSLSLQIYNNSATVTDDYDTNFDVIYG